VRNWREKAEELAGRIPAARLHPAVRRWLAECQRPPRLAVACSGGADSLCLLLLLWAHWPKCRAQLRVLHFDHRLRGEASRADAEFVNGVAAELGLRCETGEWERRPEERSTEAGARAARMAFFAASRQEQGWEAICLGHQRDDIIETQMMRLSRGSGTAGLAAPRPVQAFGDGRIHLRPLLTLAGAEIRRQLAESGIPFRVDASNDGLDFYRNRLRLEVLPLWQQHAPFDVAAGAAAARELLQEDDEALVKWLRELLPLPVPGTPYDLSPLAGRPRALLRRALQEWLAVEGMAEAVGKTAFAELLHALETDAPCKTSAGEGRFVVVATGGRLAWRGPVAFRRLLEEAWTLPGEGTLLLPGGAALTARLLTLDEELRGRILAGKVDPRVCAYVAWEGGEIRLEVRGWLPGDRYRPMGGPGTRKLQDIFVDRKVCEEERYLLPVVLRCAEIIWTPLLPPAENMKINAGTKQVVQLTYDWGKPV
jgi:tRNA(Ile)-lysidine synthase